MRDRRAIIGALAAWDIAWRLAAITVAVKRRDWRWVVPLAVISSVGLLPMGYLFVAGRRP